MARQLNRLVKILTYLLLLLLLPIVWTAHSTYTFEHYLTSLSITLSDFPPSYAAALTKATLKSEHTFDFDYSIFSLHSANNTDSSNGSTFSAVHATSRNTIPPIVHFIWFADLYDTTLGEHKNAIPHSRSHAPKRCRLFNPSYTINIWNASAAESFLEEHYAWILPTYHSYPYPIQRIDLLKYFLLYHFGGVYMDLDIACRRPLEPLLEFAAWIPKASPMGVNNDLIAARPGHPLLEYMTGRLPDRNRWLGSEWLTVFWSTGPRFASDMLREWYDTRPGERHVASYTKSADACKYFTCYYPLTSSHGPC